MSIPLIVANWKMNFTVEDALKFFAIFTSELKASSGVDVAIAPPFTALYSLSVAMAETDFSLASQNIFWEDSGAFTGEISGAFLSSIGCKFAIIGHSERRTLFGETDKTVNLRCKAAIRNNLTPILCIGETLEQHDKGMAWDVVKGQLKSALGDIDIMRLNDFVAAYEPVWAIGTGRTATPEEAEQMHSAIRKQLMINFGAGVNDKLRIIYGGSVKPSNSRELLSKQDIDGVLVGGASLNPQHFAAIVRSAH